MSFQEFDFFFNVDLAEDSSKSEITIKCKHSC